MRRLILFGLTAVSLAVLLGLFGGGAAGGVAFVVATALFPVLLMALGAVRPAARGDRLATGLRWALAGLAVLLAGSLLAMLALRGAVEDGPRIWGLPAAAVVQLVGLAGLPLLLVAVAYAAFFQRHGVREEDLERLRSLPRNNDPGRD